MALDAFARDLGYLDQFFAKLEAHAGTLSPAGGARLKALIGEERARWTEIKSLLAGAAPSAATPSPSPAAAPTAAEKTPANAARHKPVATVSAPVAPGPQKSETRFTVGSLIERPR
jgi:hypothetical protein